MMTCEKVVCHQPGFGGVKRNLVLGDDGQVLGQIGDPEVSHRAGAELTGLAKTYDVEHNVGFERAFHVVSNLPENAETFQAYAGQPRETYRKRPAPSTTRAEVTAEIDYRVREYRIAHCDSDYGRAMAAVFEDDEELKQAYAET